jgi:hypothetical protein
MGIGFNLLGLDMCHEELDLTAITHFDTLKLTFWCFNESVVDAIIDEKFRSVEGTRTQLCSTFGTHNKPLR